MTYYVGVRLDTGLILASDSRTNEGLDNYLKFCKMTVFERKGDRVIVPLSSGNLAGTQAIVSLLNQRAVDPACAASIWTVGSVAAQASQRREPVGVDALILGRRRGTASLLTYIAHAMIRAAASQESVSDSREN